MLQKLTILAASVVLTGCATFDEIVSNMKKSGPEAVIFEDRPVQEPIDPNSFMLGNMEQGVIGEPQVVFTTDQDTFSDLARTYGLGYDELVAANPDVDPWLPGAGTPILLPTQFVLPDVEKRGVVLNIATKRLFYFPQSADGEQQKVLTYPIGIGRVGWETPLGETTVIAKAKDPSWWVPASVRKEHAELGDPLPSIVPPGPDNPLGHRVLKLNMPGYLIHGTNQPYGVGMRVSHGCVRLYPENIEFLYTLVDIGERVEIVNEPYLAGIRDGVLYFEGHAPLEDDTVLPADRLHAVLEKQLDVAGQPLNDHMREHVVALAESASGVPVNVAMYDAAEPLRRARLVHNIVVPDPDEPTIEEVREMMSEVAEEGDAS